MTDEQTLVTLDFDERFADDIAGCGYKCQTIRRTPKCQRGDLLELRCGDRLLLRTRCTGVQPVTIHADMMLLSGRVVYPGFAFRDDPQDHDGDFAKKEGFEGLTEMSEWFSHHYGKPSFYEPFEGFVISWERQ